jgi:hypothetical protein
MMSVSLHRSATLAKLQGSTVCPRPSSSQLPFGNEGSTPTTDTLSTADRLKLARVLRFIFTATVAAVRGQSLAAYRRMDYATTATAGVLTWETLGSAFTAVLSEVDVAASDFGRVAKNCCDTDSDCTHNRAPLVEAVLNIVSAQLAPPPIRTPHWATICTACASRHHHSVYAGSLALAILHELQRHAAQAHGSDSPSAGADANTITEAAFVSAAVATLLEPTEPALFAVTPPSEPKRREARGRELHRRAAQLALEAVCLHARFAADVIYLSLRAHDDVLATLMADDDECPEPPAAMAKRCVLPWRPMRGLFDVPLLQRFGQWFLQKKDEQYMRLRRRFLRLHHARNADTGVFVSSSAAATQPASLIHKITRTLLPEPLAALGAFEDEERSEFCAVRRGAIIRAMAIGFVASTIIAAVELAAAFLLLGGRTPSLLSSDSILMVVIKTVGSWIGDQLHTATGQSIGFLNATSPSSTAGGSPSTTPLPVETSASHDPVMEYWLIVMVVTIVITAVEVAMLYADSLSACYDLAAVAGVSLHVDEEIAAQSKGRPISQSEDDLLCSSRRMHSVGASAMTAVRDEAKQQRNEHACAEAAVVQATVTVERTRLLDTAVSRCALGLGHGTTTFLGIDVTSRETAWAQIAQRVVRLVRSSASAAVLRFIAARVLSKFALPFVSLPLILVWNALVAARGMREARAAVLAAVHSPATAASILNTAVGAAADGTMHYVPVGGDAVREYPHVRVSTRQLVLRALLTVGEVHGEAPAALHLIAAHVATHTLSGGSAASVFVRPPSTLKRGHHDAKTDPRDPCHATTTTPTKLSTMPTWRTTRSRPSLAAPIGRVRP